MVRSRALLAVALAALLLSAGCLGAVAGTDDTRTDGEIVQVSATGQATAEPDQAVLRLSVVATGEDAETARTRLAENVSAMRDALREAGVADDQVATVRYDLGENHRGPREEDAPAYRAIQSFEVTLNETDRVGEVVDVAVANGASRVDRVRFTLSSERQRELEQEALADAMNASRRKASTLADSGGLQLAGVHRIETSPQRRGYVLETAAASDAGGGTSIDSGPVTVTVQVQVTYNATEA